MVSQCELEGALRDGGDLLSEVGEFCGEYADERAVHRRLGLQRPHAVEDGVDDQLAVLVEVGLEGAGEALDVRGQIVEVLVTHAHKQVHQTLLDPTVIGLILLLVATLHERERREEVNQRSVRTVRAPKTRLS